MAGRHTLPDSGPLPEHGTWEALCYYFFITGNLKRSMLLSGFVPNGMTARGNFKRSVDTIWMKPNFQRLLKKEVEKMAKKKLKITRASIQSPEAKIETVEDLIATAEEVLVYLTACMRGKISEEVLMARLSEEGQQVIERLQKQVCPRDRTKAAELLAKRYGLLEYRYSIDVNKPVIFAGEEDLE